jgi:cellulose synthase/poly-beta-1,6-N-acetylglucosamine synthase-like glycosyltransferase
VAFAPYAQCFTNVPTRWTKLFKQRRRWNRGVIRHKTRKHIDMAYFWSPSFQWGNFFHLIDAWVFRVGCLFAIWGFTLMTILHPPKDLLRVISALYLLYVVFQLVQVLPILFFSLDRRRDARILLVLPLAPCYQLFLRCARTCSILEEIFFRYSYKDNFYPKHVRDATWHW